ncbi:MAG: ATP-dependent DNA helicase RecG [Candidatus Cloacimonadales bacterium]|jgi:ATP-dependent DNA helicase RecG|nr:ATP-dependent DNA helicase RecG [Candidatus Cloacimonadota bacterium]MDX9977575.1 ATP-dependent DNA helicase RecG [Candidatus Cloacimonadales bacterium]
MQNIRKVSIMYLKGVGEYRAKLLASVGVESVNDLLEFFPKDYIGQSWSEEITDEHIDSLFSCIGEIDEVRERMATTGTRQFIVTIKANEDYIDLIWFRYGKWLTKSFIYGGKIWVSGFLSSFNGRYQIVHPQYEVLNERDQLNDFWKTRSRLPVYPTVGNLTQTQLRNLIYNAFQQHHAYIDETLPDYIINKYKYDDRKTALQKVHFNTKPKNTEFLKDRFVFEELFYQQIMMIKNKNMREKEVKSKPFKLHNTFTKKLLESLPFQLTGAQKRVIQEIFADMQSDNQMSRLLQGDVGSGKTVVTLFAMLLAKENGYQSALMAPTEILADQHFRTISSMLENMPEISIGLLTGGVSKAKNELKRQIIEGEVDIVVGTHALIQKDVLFHNLAFIAVDEQHRFGVHQRAALSLKHKKPDMLYLSATPIPRSLALTIFGELDVSIINELPPTRKPIKTKWIHEHAKTKAYQDIEKEIEAGRQVYIVCPLIEDSEKIDLLAAESLLTELQRFYFPNYKSALLHGKMKAKAKDEIMQLFANNEIQILVSTTVIEVGIDVPNASVMMIEHAERFGLAQLHQLRGRVGRGAEQSYCYLVSYRTTEIAKARLTMMEKSNDGFEIAEKDLELRGPGEFHGKHQSGLPPYKFANLALHQECLNRARADAIELLDDDPKFEKAENQIVKYLYDEYYEGKEKLIDY